jgi:hypothetical protein
VNAPKQPYQTIFLLAATHHQRCPPKSSLPFLSFLLKIATSAAIDSRDRPVAGQLPASFLKKIVAIGFLA